MMIYYICRNPDIEAKVRKQIDEHIKGDKEVTY